MVNKIMRSILISFFICSSFIAYSQKYFLFIGTYTNIEHKGIYVYTFDVMTGKSVWVSNTDGVINPSYLAVNPSGSLLYACNETKIANGGGVSAFNFDHNKGQLSFINKQSSGGDDPAYISVYKNGRWVVAGNYSGGNLSALAVNKNGSLQPFNQLIQHTGKSINKERQEKAHVHSTVFSPNGKYLFAADLGIDKIMIYKFNPSILKPLQPLPNKAISTDPGSGPRHFIFHPNRKWAYLIEELAGKIIEYTYLMMVNFFMHLTCLMKIILVFFLLIANQANYY